MEDKDSDAGTVDDEDVEEEEEEDEEDIEVILAEEFEVSH